VTDLDMRDIAA